MKFSLLSLAAVLAASSCSASPAPRNQLHAVDLSHLPIRRDPTRPQPVLQRRTGGETIIIVEQGGGGPAQGAAKPTVTRLQTVTTQTTVAPAGTAPPAPVAPPPAVGTGAMPPPGMGAAQPSGTGGAGALPVQQPAPTQSLLPVTAGAGPRGFADGQTVAGAAALVSGLWAGFWALV